MKAVPAGEAIPLPLDPDVVFRGGVGGSRKVGADNHDGGAGNGLHPRCVGANIGSRGAAEKASSPHRRARGARWDDPGPRARTVRGRGTVALDVGDDARDRIRGRGEAPCRQAPTGRAHLVEGTARGVALVPAPRDLRLQIPRNTLPRRGVELERKVGEAFPVRRVVGVGHERDEVKHAGPHPGGDGGGGRRHQHIVDGAAEEAYAPRPGLRVLREGLWEGPRGEHGVVPSDERRVGGPDAREHKGAADGRGDRGDADETVLEGAPPLRPLGSTGRRR